ncbi:MAG: hypothetical protein ACREKB_13830 [Candidatus Rokuibacteriota bacterium]
MRRIHAAFAARGIAVLLQEERAGVQVRADEAAIAKVLANDPPAS